MPFVHPVKVRFLEVDQQGVVFNMWYLAWFDEAMTAYLDALGFSFDVMLREGWDVQLVHAEVDWRGGARMYESLGVEVTPAAIGTTSFTLAFRVLRGDEAIVTGRIVYVVIASDGSGKREIHPDLRAALSA